MNCGKLCTTPFWCNSTYKSEVELETTNNATAYEFHFCYVNTLLKVHQQNSTIGVPVAGIAVMIRNVNNLKCLRHWAATVIV